MQIYLVRHGIAEERSPLVRDEERALTKRGKRRTRRALAGLRTAGLDGLDRILSSPLVRAWETAKILARELDAEGPRVESALAPGGSPASVLERLAGEPEGVRVALVGHQPDLGELATWLMVGSGRGLELGKAGVARIDLPGERAAGRGNLVWLLPPEVLRELGS